MYIAVYNEGPVTKSNRKRLIKQAYIRKTFCTHKTKDIIADAEKWQAHQSEKAFNSYENKLDTYNSTYDPILDDNLFVDKPIYYSYNEYLEKYMPHFIKLTDDELKLFKHNHTAKPRN